MLIKKVLEIEAKGTFVPDHGDIEERWISEGKNDCKYFYKEIEWLEAYFDNDESKSTFIDSACAMGEFDLLSNHRKIRVYGYKP